MAANQTLRMPQRCAWHVREKVVFDLIVQAAEQHVGEPAAAHVA